MPAYKHPSADVQTEMIGEDTRIWQFCVVLKGAKIGNNCNINSHCFIEDDVVIGNNVTIKCGVYVWNGIRIGDGVFVGPNVTFTNDMLPRSKRRPAAFLETRCETGSSIGAGAVIVAGVTIGKFAMIGAGSVVTKDIPPYSLWYGNPARLKGYVCECGSKLDSEFTCEHCGKQYATTPNGLECAT